MINKETSQERRFKGKVGWPIFIGEAYLNPGVAGGPCVMVMGGK